MSKINRRKFLGRRCGVFHLDVAGTRASGRVLGANDTIRVGVIGLNGRGKLHIEMATTTPGMTLAAVCDVDPAILARTLKVRPSRNSTRTAGRCRALPTSAKCWTRKTSTR